MNNEQIPEIASNGLLNIHKIRPMKSNNNLPTSLVIIEPPKTWRGINEFDMPSTGIVLEAITARVRHKETFIRNFNAAAFDARLFDRWAAITMDMPTQGAVVKVSPIKRQ